VHSRSAKLDETGNSFRCLGGSPSSRELATSSSLALSGTVNTACVALGALTWSCGCDNRGAWTPRSPGSSPPRLIGPRLGGFGASVRLRGRVTAAAHGRSAPRALVWH
jgi:hypothetical protein